MWQTWLRNERNFWSIIMHRVCSVLSVLSLQAEQLMKRIGVEGVKLTEYEMNIASQLVDPQTMKVTAVILSPWHWDYQVSRQFLHFFCNCIFPRQKLRQNFSQCSTFPPGVMERYSRSGRGNQWAARHCHPALSEKAPFSWIQTVSTS